MYSNFWISTTTLSFFSTHHLLPISYPPNQRKVNPTPHLLPLCYISIRARLLRRHPPRPGLLPSEHQIPPLLSSALICSIRVISVLVVTAFPHCTHPHLLTPPPTPQSETNPTNQFLEGGAGGEGRKHSEGSFIFSDLRTNSKDSSPTPSHTTRAAAPSTPPHVPFSFH